MGARHLMPRVPDRMPVHGASAFPVVTGIAVSHPERAYSQREVIQLVGLAGDDFAERMFGNAGVSQRCLEVTDDMLGQSVQARAAVAEDRIEAHAVRAIEGLDVDLSNVGTIITSTLWSLGLPTLGHRLIERLAMDPATDKYHVTGTGCAGAVPLMKLAAGSLQQEPEKKVLIVAAESTTGLLARADPTDPRAKIINAALFGDGCAVAVVSKGSTAPGPSMIKATVHQIGGTLGAVRLKFSERDGYLHLDRDLPDVAVAGLPELVDDFLSPLGLDRSRIDLWLVHPGGPRIIQCVRSALCLTDDDVRVSSDILSRFGNIGTATSFYVLREVGLRCKPTKGQYGLMVTVGPGITVGLMLLGW